MFRLTLLIQLEAHGLKTKDAEVERQRSWSDTECVSKAHPSTSQIHYADTYVPSNQTTESSFQSLCHHS